ncbi:hypothetical protein EDC63_105113 [Sulfurirhabdus autotrophica]|uniref:Uncharacterized protein n=1 Tax=Sulfurirhabdus autotrophica TaxID=1706046 RepID=A0A4R3Y9W0_9PROT|nr:hypothetical protein EDC63_105113 [Sulfurirhabdus autotrophica]
MARNVIMWIVSDRINRERLLDCKKMVENSTIFFACHLIVSWVLNQVKSKLNQDALRGARVKFGRFAVAVCYTGLPLHKCAG